MCVVYFRHDSKYLIAFNDKLLNNFNVIEKKNDDEKQIDNLSDKSKKKKRAARARNCFPLSNYKYLIIIEGKKVSICRFGDRCQFD